MNRGDLLIMSAYYPDSVLKTGSALICVGLLIHKAQLGVFNNATELIV